MIQRFINLAITIRNRARKLWRRLLQRLMVPLVLFPPTRQALADLYLRLSPAWLAWFHDRFRLILYDLPLQPESSWWSTVFGSASLRMPLRTESFALDWNQAVALTGHDLEVKMIYHALLAADRRPAVFLDVGANFGTHSLLMVANGIPTFTFEPNPTCHEHLRTLFQANGLTPRLETVALGQEAGETTLWFPPGQTWHGSTDASARTRLEDGVKWISHPVPLRTLDSYLPEMPEGRTLVKLDTEGTEALVLSGAGTLLTQRRPLVIFESLPDTPRQELWDIFATHGFQLQALAFKTRLLTRPIASQSDFATAVEENFIAVPADGPWSPLLAAGMLQDLS